MSAPQAPGAQPAGGDQGDELGAGAALDFPLQSVTSRHDEAREQAILRQGAELQRALEERGLRRYLDSAARKRATKASESPPGRA